MNSSIRQHYLQAIGIQSWQLKSSASDDFLTADIIMEPLAYQEPQQNQEPEQDQEPHSDQQLQPAQAHQPVEEPQPDNESRFAVVEQQYTPDNKPTTTDNSPPGIDKQPVLNSAAESIAPDIKASSDKVESADILSPSKILSEATANEVEENNFASQLQQTINHCKKCPSRITRLNALAGQGNSHASVVIIGGAPDVEEDRTGQYLTGRVETLFQAMLHSIAVQNDYYFTGLIKCYSMENFVLTEEELHNCTPYLHSQIDHINPSVLLVLGTPAAQAMLNSRQSFNELRGKIHNISINENDYSLIVSYHPAYLLRNPLYKKEALKDLIMVKSILNEC